MIEENYALFRAQLFLCFLYGSLRCKSDRLESLTVLGGKSL